MSEPKRALIPLLVLSSLCACTVLEDRDSCPCTLSFVTASDVGRVHVMLDARNGFLWEESVEDVEECRIPVPKGRLRCCVVRGAESGPEGSRLIPEGEDCPEYYMHRAEIDASGDTVTDTLEFHKRFCVMDISFSGVESGSVLGLEVRSTTAGYDRYGESVEGVFRHSPSRLEGGSYRLRLPRQLSSDLELRSNLRSGDSAVYPLGLYLEGMGYDWDAEDLEDVQINIDSRHSRVKIITSCWQKSFTFDLRI